MIDIQSTLDILNVCIEAEYNSIGSTYSSCREYLNHLIQGQQDLIECCDHTDNSWGWMSEEECEQNIMGGHECEASTET